MPIQQFIQGCREARDIIPVSHEGNLTKMIKARLEGEAAKSVQNRRKRAGTVHRSKTQARRSHSLCKDSQHGRGHAKPTRTRHPLPKHSRTSPRYIHVIQITLVMKNLHPITLLFAITVKNRAIGRPNAKNDAQGMSKYIKRKTVWILKQTARLRNPFSSSAR